MSDKGVVYAQVDAIITVNCQLLMVACRGDTLLGVL